MPLLKKWKQDQFYPPPNWSAPLIKVIADFILIGWEMSWREKILTTKHLTPQRDNKTIIVSIETSSTPQETGLAHFLRSHLILIFLIPQHQEYTFWVGIVYSM